MDKCQSTWEDHTRLQKTYRNFNFENKVVLNGGEIVSNSVRIEINEAKMERVENGHVTTNCIRKGEKVLE